MQILGILFALLLLCLIILVHELGHFLVGRATGMRVDAFYIGFGPKLISWGKGETEYSIRLLPLGGACVFHGEDENGIDDPRAMNNMPVWKRFLTIAAGPVTNLVTAFLLTIVLLVGIGLPAVVPVIGEFTENSAAQEAGMETGDRILAINGESVNGDYEAARSLIQKAGETEAIMTVERGSEQLDIAVTPQLDENGTPVVGIYFGQEGQRMGFFEGVKQSFSFQIEIMRVMLTSLRDLFFQGQGVDDMMGPVGTVAMISSFAQQGAFNVIYLMILISINVAIFNLLPIPALDGSRLVFLIIEGIRKKPLGGDKEAIVHFVGFIALIGLMLVFTYKDIVKLVTGGFPF